MKILFTDTHFGIKQNSQTWLSSQMDFIYKQIIPMLKEAKSMNEAVTVVHLGDVFDSRSTIGVLAASQVKEAFRRIASLADEFIIIGGNHDYYSPNAESVDTLSLLFGDIQGITLVTESGTPMVYRTPTEAPGDERGGSLYLSWYAWHDHMDAVEGMVRRFRPSRIYTHADIYGVTPEAPKIPDFMAGCRIYSGHVHIPNFKTPGLFNLGSCYPLTFADHDSDRGCYLQREDALEFIPNEVSIRFRRIRGMKALRSLAKRPGDPRDYVEIYLPREGIIDPDTQKILKTLDYRNMWVIPEAGEGIVMEHADIKNIDIDACIDRMVPEGLKEKMDQVRKRVAQGLDS